jgi:hypothetical protein
MQFTIPRIPQSRANYFVGLGILGYESGNKAHLRALPVTSAPIPEEESLKHLRWTYRKMA